MPKELILSVTTSDFEWKFIRGSGPGGQHRNKVSTGCRCTHRDSGAVGVATNSKSQKANRKEAFLKCTKSEKFQAWLRMEVAKRTGKAALIEAEVDESLSNKNNIRVEVKKEGDGRLKTRWIQFTKYDDTKVLVNVDHLVSLMEYDSELEDYKKCKSALDLAGWEDILPIKEPYKIAVIWLRELGQCTTS